MDTLTYLIALTNVFRTSPSKLRSLLERYPDAREAWERLEYEGKEKAIEKAQQEQDFIHAHDIAVYTIQDAAYPTRLKQCSDAPWVLFGKGKLDLNKGKFLSVVGTRQATPFGQDMTRRLVLDLAEEMRDLTIVSGLAYGIDVAAHRAALEAGLPTIIIPAHGLDRIYPAIHRPVAVSALRNGGILTEYPSGTEPEKMNFVARNRIIAGMSDAVVVVESKERGGSLITAGFANDYNRDVLTFPGRVTDSNAKGCNNLIRTHQAELVESAEDVMQVMGWKEQVKGKTYDTQITLGFDDMSPEEKQLISILKEENTPVHINQLVTMSGLTYSQTVETLMGLEFNDKVRSLPGGMYMIRS